MAIQEYVDLLKSGVIDEWNKWRRNNPYMRVDLSGADLRRVDLSKADLSGADLSGADLREANLSGADLRLADLRREYLSPEDFSRGVNGKRADLRGANLSNADFSEADLSEADLSKSDLSNSNLVDTILLGADLSECRIYGISVWNIEIDGNTKQKDLVITKKNESIITVDNIEVAQFIYLLLDNNKIRNVINTITSKVILIIGRFTDERKMVLQAIKKELKRYNYTPVLFDFDKPNDRNFIETISTLAHMARFVIADFTDPKIILQEAQHIIPNIAIPFVPIFLKGSGIKPVTIYDLGKGRTTILRAFCYEDTSHLLENLYEKIIKPAEKRAEKLNKKNPIKFNKKS